MPVAVMCVEIQSHKGKRLCSAAQAQQRAQLEDPFLLSVEGGAVRTLSVQVSAVRVGVLSEQNRFSMQRHLKNI